MTLAAGSIVLMTISALAQSQDGRKALASDVAFINDPKNALLKNELIKLRLSPKPELSSLCKIYLPTSDISLGTSRFQTDKAFFDLPFSKILMWDIERPFSDSQIYHIFANSEHWNENWFPVPSGQDVNSTTTETHNFIGRPIGHFPTEDEVTANGFGEVSKFPFEHNGNNPDGSVNKWSNFMVHDYVIPIPGSNNFTTYSEVSIRTTCLRDVHRDTNCICADSE